MHEMQLTCLTTKMTQLNNKYLSRRKRKWFKKKNTQNRIIQTEKSYLLLRQQLVTGRNMEEMGKENR